MVARGRFAGAVVAAVLGATALGGCSLIGLGEQDPLTCQGETAPSSAPGDADVLLTIAQGKTRWELTTVVYSDGAVALIDDGGASGPSGPPTWQGGYLLPCALDEARSLAEDALFGAPDFGEVARPDSTWTWVRYNGGALRAVAQVDGFASGYTEGLGWDQRRAREDLRALTEFLAVNIVATGEDLPVTAVQVDAGGGEAGAAGEGDKSGGASGEGGANGEGDASSGGQAAPQVPKVPEVAGWPGPPLTDLLGEQRCGVLTEDSARQVYVFAADSETGLPQDSPLHLRVLPPGINGCS